MAKEFEFLAIQIFFFLFDINKNTEAKSKFMAEFPAVSTNSYLRQVSA